MNEIQSSLFDAMKQFSEHTKNSSNATVTVEATIVDILDDGTGEYLVEYLGNKFPAYAQTNASYAVGDNVYILVPDGDFSKNKVILSLVAPVERTSFTDPADEDVYYKLCDNFIKNGIISNVIELSSYDTTIYEGVMSGASGRASYDIEDMVEEGYRIFAISLSAKTNLDISQRGGGNYGFSVKIPVRSRSTGENGWKIFTVDVSNMLGDPYRFEVWSPQTIYFVLEDDYDINTSYSSEDARISYFCYGFHQDETKINIKDIFLKDIEFYSVEKLPKEDNKGLKVTLNATHGRYFWSSNNEAKTITPTVTFDGKNIPLSDNIDIYWFEEDASVKSDNKYYCCYGGVGWKCVNDITESISNDGVSSVTFDTHQTSYSLTSYYYTKVVRIKCVIIYNKNQASNIISIKNLHAAGDLILTTDNEDNIFLKDVGYVTINISLYIPNVTNTVSNKSNIIYSFLRYDKNGDYIEDSDDFFEFIQYNELVNNSRFESIVRFPTRYLIESNTIYCSAIRINPSANSYVVANTQSITVSTVKNLDYILTINGDNVLYKYDVNGNSPLSLAYDGPPASKITSVTPLEVIIKKRDGTEFTEEEYALAKFEWTVPSQSLFKITGGRTSKILNYTIADRYNASYAKQQITLKVTIRDVVLNQTIDITFLKEGENGSNGTSWTAQIVAGDSVFANCVPYGVLDENGIPKKIKFVYNLTTQQLYLHKYDTDELILWNRQLYFYIRLYRDGKPYQFQTSGTNGTCYWSMFDPGVTDTCFKVYNSGNTYTNTVTLNPNKLPTSISDRPCNILQAKITIRNFLNMETTKLNDTSVAYTELYAYYPIEITLINDFDASSPILIPSIEGGFSEVMYNSGGLNPSWDETKPFYYANRVLLKNLIPGYLSLFSRTLQCSNHLKLISSTGSEYVVSPNNKYNDGNSKNYIAGTLTMSQSSTAESWINQNQSIINTATNDKTYLEFSLRHLQNLATHYYINDWLSTFETIKDLLNQRTSALSASRIADDYTQNLYNYLRTQMQANGNNDILDTCEDLMSELNGLHYNIQSAQSKLYSFSDYAFISLEPYKITWTPQMKQRYIEKLGLDITLYIETSIQDINSQIDTYQIYYNAILAYSSTTYLQDYQGILNGIRDAAYQIQVYYDTDDVLQLRKNLLNSVPLFAKKVSYTESLELLDYIYETVLKPVFAKTSEGIEVSQNTLNTYQNKIAECNEKINTSTEIISELNNTLAIANLQMAHIRPIVLYFNRYEMSNINAWDGNKIYTGTNDEYLLAPQVGAGIKESDNSFTGIVIGQRNYNISSTSVGAETGLFGYYKGKQSIFMNSKTGAAIFGISGTGGQIIIDPTSSSKKALLYSSNFWKEYDSRTGLPSSYASSNYNGAGLLIDLTTPEIRYGSGNFVVNSSGHITAKGGGSIAGWNISDTSLSKNNITLNSEGSLSGGTSFNWSITKDGTATFNKLIASNSGTIGGWTIGQTTLTGGNTTLNSDGTINCSNLIANTNGNIGGWTINNAGLVNASRTVVLGADGTLAGGPGDGTATWILGNTGEATFLKINATGGKIGGWNVNGTSLYVNDNLKLSSTSGIIANSGKIGGWTISSDGLSNGDAQIYSSGIIKGKQLVAYGTSGLVTGAKIQGQQIEASQSIKLPDGRDLSEVISYLMNNKAGTGTYSFSGSASVDPVTGQGSCSGTITL